MTDEALMDFPAFLQVLTAELLAGLINEENHQILLGNGTAPDLTGILNTAGILTRARSSDTQLDALLKAISDLRSGTSYADADGIVMNPADWTTVFLQKSTTNEYIAGDPLNGASRTLWGIPLVVTTQITAGTALVASFQELGEVYLRMAPRIDVANQGTTQFINNTALVRCEERLALGVQRPTAAVKVTEL
jgi:HK97 family phage major capsid protein